MFQQQPPYIPTQPTQMQQGYYYEPAQSAEFSVETMHGMPGYPGRPPIPRSNQTSPLNPSPPYPHYPASQPYSRPSTAQTQAYGGMWGSPPISPVLGPMQYGINLPPGAHSRHPSQIDEFGGLQGGRGIYYGTAPPSVWTSPSAPSTYTFYTPLQQQAATMDVRPVAEAWSERNSPVVPQGSGYGSWVGPPRSYPQANRQSWAGPSRPVVNESPEKEDTRERKAYHPQPPARRSDWVMWVGNV